MPGPDPHDHHHHRRRRRSTDDLFQAGLVVHSEAAYEALCAAEGSAHGNERPAGVMPGAEYLERHLSGDSGEEASEELRQANLSAIEGGYRVVSRYQLPTGEELVVVTEAEVRIGERFRTYIVLGRERLAQDR